MKKVALCAVFAVAVAGFGFCAEGAGVHVPEKYSETVVSPSNGTVEASTALEGHENWLDIKLDGNLSGGSGTVFESSTSTNSTLFWMPIGRLPKDAR